VKHPFALNEDNSTPHPYRSHGLPLRRAAPLEALTSRFRLETRLTLPRYLEGGGGCFFFFLFFWGGGVWVFFFFFFLGVGGGWFWGGTLVQFPLPLDAPAHYFLQDPYFLLHACPQTPAMICDARVSSFPSRMKKRWSVVELFPFFASFEDGSYLFNILQLRLHS